MAAVSNDRTDMDAAPRTPTDRELRAHVRRYFSMLEGELRGRASRGGGFWGARDDAANAQREHTHRQIAAILVEEGLPFHSRYRPLLNYSQGLRGAVEAYLRNHPELFRLMEADVDQSSGPVPEVGRRGVDTIASRAPEPGEIPEIAADSSARANVSGTDFLAREQRNRALARSGERFVVEYEIQRLRDAGAPVHADAVEHVAAEQGGAGGYDIHSYDADGGDRYIKVKTTRYRRETPFFITAKEIAMAAIHRQHFWLYRVFECRDGLPRLYAMNGPLHERFRLQPIAYRAIPR